SPCPLSAKPRVTHLTAMVAGGRRGSDAGGRDDLRSTTQALRLLRTRTSARLMVSDLDIYRAANLLINRHGTNALIEAARMIDRMLDLGDPEGKRVWLWIKRAIEELEAQPSGAAH